MSTDKIFTAHKIDSGRIMSVYMYILTVAVVSMLAMHHGPFADGVILPTSMHPVWLDMKPSFSNVNRSIRDSDGSNATTTRSSSSMSMNRSASSCARTKPAFFERVLGLERGRPFQFDMRKWSMLKSCGLFTDLTVQAVECTDGIALNISGFERPAVKISPEFSVSASLTNPEISGSLRFRDGNFRGMGESLEFSITKSESSPSTFDPWQMPKCVGKWSDCAIGESSHVSIGVEAQTNRRSVRGILPSKFFQQQQQQQQQQRSEKSRDDIHSVQSSQLYLRAESFWKARSIKKLRVGVSERTKPTHSKTQTYTGPSSSTASGAYLGLGLADKIASLFSVYRASHFLEPYWLRFDVLAPCPRSSDTIGSSTSSTTNDIALAGENQQNRRGEAEPTLKNENVGSFVELTGAKLGFTAESIGGWVVRGWHDGGVTRRRQKRSVAHRDPANMTDGTQNREAERYFFDELGVEITSPDSIACSLSSLFTSTRATKLDQQRLQQIAKLSGSPKFNALNKIKFWNRDNTAIVGQESSQPQQLHSSSSYDAATAISSTNMLMTRIRSSLRAAHEECVVSLRSKLRMSAVWGSGSLPSLHYHDLMTSRNIARGYVALSPLPTGGDTAAAAARSSTSGIDDNKTPLRANTISATGVSELHTLKNDIYMQGLLSFASIGIFSDISFYRSHCNSNKGYGGDGEGDTSISVSSSRDEDHVGSLKSMNTGGSSSSDIGSQHPHLRLRRRNISNNRESLRIGSRYYGFMTSVGASLRTQGFRIDVGMPVLGTADCSILHRPRFYFGLDHE